MQAALTIFVLVLAFCCVLFCVFRPKYAIVPVLMLFPIDQILEGYITGLVQQYGKVVNIAVGLIALMGVGYSFFSGKPVFRGTKNGVCLAVFALYTYIFLSIAWSPSRDAVFFYLNQSLPYFVLLYLLTPLLVKRLDDLESLAVPLMLVGTVVLVLMLINPNAKFINGRFVIDLGYMVGAGEQRTNPLAIADAGGALAILGAVYRPNSIRPAVTLLRWAAVLLGLLLALMSGSRGQVIAAVAVIAILVPFINRSRSAGRIAGSMAAVGVVLFALYGMFQLFLGSTEQSRFGLQASTEGFSDRLAMIEGALNGYLSSPAFWPTGLGAAAFNASYTWRPTGFEFLYPHNILVETITEYGLPGIALFIAICVMSFKNCAALVRMSGDDRSKRTAALAFGGILLFQFMMSMKQGAMLLMPQVFMFALIIANVARNEKLDAEEAWAHAPQDETGTKFAEEDGADSAWLPAEG
jgi:hypothetical protein